MPIILLRIIDEKKFLYQSEFCDDKIQSLAHAGVSQSRCDEEQAYRSITEGVVKILASGMSTNQLYHDRCISDVSQVVEKFLSNGFERLGLVVRERMLGIKISFNRYSKRYGLDCTRSRIADRAWEEKKSDIFRRESPKLKLKGRFKCVQAF